MCGFSQTIVWFNRVGARRRNDGNHLNCLPCTYQCSAPGAYMAGGCSLYGDAWCAQCPRGTIYNQFALRWQNSMYWYYKQLGFSDYCSACPPGSYSRLDGLVSCSGCLPGQYMDQYGATACLSAPPGTYVPDGSEPAYTLCPPGAYAPAAGLTTCTGCSIGTYQPAAGASVPCTLTCVVNVSYTIPSACVLCTLVCPPGTYAVPCTLLVMPSLLYGAPAAIFLLIT